MIKHGRYQKVTRVYQYFFPPNTSPSNQLRFGGEECRFIEDSTFFCYGFIAAANICLSSEALVVVVVVEAWRLELTRRSLGYFTLKTLPLYPPHAIVMRLHGRDSYVVILMPAMADLRGLWCLNSSLS